MHTRYDSKAEADLVRRYDVERLPYQPLQQQVLTGPVAPRAVSSAYLYLLEDPRSLESSTLSW